MSDWSIVAIVLLSAFVGGTLGAAYVSATHRRWDERREARRAARRRARQAWRESDESAW